MTYPDDDNYEFFMRDELFEADERLREDGEFLDKLHDLFDYDLLRDFEHGAEDVFNDLAEYLDEYYDIDLEYYWDWGEWKDEYNAA